MEENKELLNEEQNASCEYNTETKEESIKEIEVEASKEKDNVSEKEISEIKDYETVMRQDIEELHSIFPHLQDKKSVLDLDNPLRYAALRDLGLSPKEAYLATSNINTTYDNRSHITSSAPKGASPSSELLTATELESARMIFSDLSDREIQKLYKKVTK